MEIRIVEIPSPTPADVAALLTPAGVGEFMTTHGYGGTFVDDNNPLMAVRGSNIDLGVNHNAALLLAKDKSTMVRGLTLADSRAGLFVKSYHGVVAGAHGSY